MTTLTDRATDIKVGDVIYIPAWKVTGCVMAVLPSLFAENRDDVRLQTHPEQSESQWQTYRLKAGEFTHVQLR